MSTKVSQLQEDTSPSSDDLVLAVDNATGTSKKVTMGNLVGIAGAAYTSGVDATTSTKGKVKLANDLGGTADLPTVVATHLTSALPLAQGGTAATSASAARTSLGVAIGSDVQAYNANTALRTDKLSAFAATTSAELKTVLSDETGTGAAVFANSPALVTPTGIVKGDVGLGSVDNTSDATKNAAVASLTNKDLTSGNTFPTLNQNTTGSAAKLTTARTINGTSFDGTANITVTAAGSTLSDTVPIANGGTGQVTANAATNALLPSQATHSGQFLTTDGSNTSWSAASGAGIGDVSSNTSSSVDTEVALFSGTAGKTIKRATGSGIAKLTSGVLSSVTAPSGTLVGDTDTQTLTNKSLSDSTTSIVDNSDATKVVKFDVTGTTGITGTIATGFTTAKTLTLPDATDTLVGKATTDTLINKTLTTPTIGSFTNATHNHSNAAGGGTVAESVITFTDITTNNVSTTQHGYAPKAPNNAGRFLDGVGAYSAIVKNRQGGTTGDGSWHTAGTSNTDTSAKNIIIQCGSVTTSAGADITITFPSAFAQAPIVTFGIHSQSGDSHVVTTGTTTTTVTGVRTVNNADSRVSETLHWMAIGQA